MKQPQSSLSARAICQQLNLRRQEATDVTSRYVNTLDVTIAAVGIDYMSRSAPVCCSDVVPSAQGM